MLVREDSHEEKPWFLAWMSTITSEMDFTYVLFPLQTMVHTMVRVIFGICKYMTILVSWLISSVVSWLPITLKIKTQILARNDQELQNLHLFILGIPFLLYWLPCSVILHVEVKVVPMKLYIYVILMVLNLSSQNYMEKGRESFQKKDEQWIK